MYLMNTTQRLQEVFGHLASVRKALETRIANQRRELARLHAEAKDLRFTRGLFGRFLDAMAPGEVSAVTKRMARAEAIAERKQALADAILAASSPIGTDEQRREREAQEEFYSPGFVRVMDGIAETFGA